MTNAKALVNKKINEFEEKEINLKLRYLNIKKCFNVTADFIASLMINYSIQQQTEKQHLKTIIIHDAYDLLK